MGTFVSKSGNELGDASAPNDAYPGVDASAMRPLPPESASVYEAIQGTDTWGNRG